jgi:hypothetical protein
MGLPCSGAWHGRQSVVRSSTVSKPQVRAYRRWSALGDFSPSHGGNAGSNPAGDANSLNEL